MAEKQATLNISMQEVINVTHPVGSYYWSSRATSPEDLWHVGTKE